MRPSSKDSTGETTKPIGKSSGICWQIYCAYLVSKNLMKYRISLRVQNKNQYTNHLMNNAVKNQVYQNKSQCISLEWLIGLYKILASLSARLIQPLSQDVRKELICKTINITRRLVSLNIIEDLNLESKSEWFI